MAKGITVIINLTNPQVGESEMNIFLIISKICILPDSVMDLDVRLLNEIFERQTPLMKARFWKT